MPIKKGSKRTWDAGWPKVEGEIVKVMVNLRADQRDFLKANGNVSQQIRDLIDAVMKPAKKGRRRTEPASRL